MPSKMHSCMARKFLFDRAGSFDRLAEAKLSRPATVCFRLKIWLPMTFLSRAVLLLLVLIDCSCSRRSNQAPDPLSADKSLQSFRLSEDFHVELFATEPNVVDPVDIAFDENGKIYVAE